MKKIVTIIIALMAYALPMMAQDSGGNSTSAPIILNPFPIDDKPQNPIHRAPMRISVEAYYDSVAGTISINYDGEAEGEVNLFRNGELIDSSSEINTVFLILGSGFYTVEINTDYWTATGSIEI